MKFDINPKIALPALATAVAFAGCATKQSNGQSPMVRLSQYTMASVCGTEQFDVRTAEIKESDPSIVLIQLAKPFESEQGRVEKMRLTCPMGSLPEGGYKALEGRKILAVYNHRSGKDGWLTGELIFVR